MGKTLPPFSQLVEAECRRWAQFKRALPKADQSLFDRLFDCAKVNVQARVYVSRPWPFEVIVMAILFEQQKQLEALERRIQALLPSPLQTGPKDHLHQCGLKTTVLDWCKSSPINTSTIAYWCPRFPLGSMVAHCTEVSGVRPTYLRTRAKEVVAMFVPCPSR
jgi:hypothetical protein